jgi:hypothetical protein
LKALLAQRSKLLVKNNITRGAYQTGVEPVDGIVEGGRKSLKTPWYGCSLALQSGEQDVRTPSKFRSS